MEAMTGKPKPQVGRDRMGAEWTGAGVGVGLELGLASLWLQEAVERGAMGSEKAVSSWLSSCLGNKADLD